jgi:starch phosphorylase
MTSFSPFAKEVGVGVYTGLPQQSFTVLRNFECLTEISTARQLSHKLKILGSQGGSLSSPRKAAASARGGQRNIPAVGHRQPKELSLSTQSSIETMSVAEISGANGSLRHPTPDSQLVDLANGLYVRHLEYDGVVDPAAVGARERFEAIARSVRDISLADLIRRFRRENSDWKTLPETVAIQLNDTHPSMAVPELMRILLDDAHLGWMEAWDLTTNTLGYTNHTLLPEALEKWPLAWFEALLPRHLEIIYEINRRLLASVRARFPADEGRVERISLIEEGAPKHVRMANLAIVGSHSTNGVAAIHSELLRTTTVKDLADLFPERFNNKTNGVSPRRWLLSANPPLASLITRAIGDDWVTDLTHLSKLKPLVDADAFRADFKSAKRRAKCEFASWLKASSGQSVDPESIFDCHIKRIHEYKRQLLNALRIIVLYNRLRENPKLAMAPRTFFFAGKAAPAYALAKLIIKFIENLAGTMNGDPAMLGRLKVLFLPEYDVTLAERLIPASDVSNQISTAGYEASGTSNMKFMMNGALTIGTHDGATIEMAQEAGAENFFLFGLTADQVATSRGWYNPRWHYEHEPETRAALDLIRGDYFSRNEPGTFAPIYDAILTHGDHYMHLADLSSYLQADERLRLLYADPEQWARKAILNVAGSGKFSSDRAIGEYATQIWQVTPCPVP